MSAEPGRSCGGRGSLLDLSVFDLFRELSQDAFSERLLRVTTLSKVNFGCFGLSRVDCRCGEVSVGLSVAGSCCLGVRLPSVAAVEGAVAMGDSRDVLRLVILSTPFVLSTEDARVDVRLVVVSWGFGFSVDKISAALRLDILLSVGDFCVVEFSVERSGVPPFVSAVFLGFSVGLVSVEACSSVMSFPVEDFG